MSWYYAEGSEQKGPVEQAELEQLMQQGSITPATLVWREGMADWQPYSEAFGASQPVATPALSRGGILCSECGRSFAPDEVIRLGNAYVCAACKPIATQKLREGVANQGAEQVRQEHIKHEASIKSVGFLYFLGATLLGLVSVVSLAVPRGNGGGLTSLMSLFFLVLAAVQIWLGIGLRGLKRWARIPSGILSGIGLLGFPMGTLINGYILYLLFSKKGAMVFSDEYQRVIAETPHVKYRTSIVVWVLLALLLVLMVVGWLAAVFAKPH